MKVTGDVVALEILVGQKLTSAAEETASVLCSVGEPRKRRQRASAVVKTCKERVEWLTNKAAGRIPYSKGAAHWR
jgi:hypothetical protein